MTTFVSDGGLFVSDLLVIGLLVLLAVVLGFGLTVTFIVWRLVRGVRRWVARRRGVAAAQPGMVRRPGPARDVHRVAAGSGCAPLGGPATGSGCRATADGAQARARA